MPEPIQIRRRIGGLHGLPTPIGPAGELAYNNFDDTLSVSDGTNNRLLVSPSKTLRVNLNDPTLTQPTPGLPNYALLINAQDAQPTGTDIEAYGTAGALAVRRANGTMSSVISAPGPTNALQNNDAILSLVARGHDGATYPAGAAGRITINADEPVTATNASGGWNATMHGTKIAFEQTLRSTATIVDVGAFVNGALVVGGLTAIPVSPQQGHLYVAQDITVGTTLLTSASTIGAAINELHGVATTGLTLVGSYHASGPNAGTVTAPASSPAGPVTNGPFPGAAAANRGWVFIVQDGPGPTPAGVTPPATMSNGDWLYSNEAEWLHFDMGAGSLLAANITFAPIVGPPAIAGNTVQLAIEQLNTAALRTVAVTGPALTGTGTAGSPITIAGIDGGVW